MNIKLNIVNIKKKFQDDVAKTVLFNYLGTACHILTGLILAPLIIRHLGLDSFGYFTFIFSIKMIIDLGAGWIQGPFIKSYIHNRSDPNISRSIIACSYVIFNLYGLISLISILFLYLTTSMIGSLNTALFIGGALCFNWMTVPSQIYFNSVEKQSFVSSIRFLQQFIFLILSVCIFIFFYRSLNAIFFSYLISFCVVFILIHTAFLKQIMLNSTQLISCFNQNVLKKILFKEGYQFAGFSLIQGLLLQSDILLLNLFYGLESVAVYTIIWKIPNIIYQLGWQFTSPLSAEIANDYNKNNINKNKVFYYEKILFMAIAIFIVIYIFFGNFMLNIWIGESFVPNIQGMYLLPSLLASLLIIQRLYINCSYYLLNLLPILGLFVLEIVGKLTGLILLFGSFGELSTIIAWIFTVGCGIIFLRFRYVAIIFKYERRLCESL